MWLCFCCRAWVYCGGGDDGGGGGRRRGLVVVVAAEEEGIGSVGIGQEGIASSVGIAAAAAAVHQSH